MSEEEGSKEAFLDRWSRRKLAKPEEQKPALQKAEAPREEKRPAPPLPPIEGLTPDSDFKPFMAANVDAETRRAALKKLFADAHFNVPDPFEAYSEDYTGGEKIPVEMLKRINEATKLVFDDEAKTAQASTEPTASNAPTEQTAAAQPEAKDVAGKQDT